MAAIGNYKLEKGRLLCSGGGDLSGSQRKWIEAAGNIYDNDIEKIVNWNTKAKV